MNIGPALFANVLLSHFMTKCENPETVHFNDKMNMKEVQTQSGMKSP